MQYVTSNIQFFANGSGQLMAACATGLAGRINPSDNRAIPEPRTHDFSLLAGSKPGTTLRTTSLH